MIDNFLRQIFKKIIPPEWRHRLWALRQWIRSKRKQKKPLGWFSIFTFVVKFLVKGLELEDKLDYEKFEVKMETESEIELFRLNSCKKEPETVAWLEKNIRPGDVFYDIGANVGAYSFVAYASSGGKCKIFAFEPSFPNFAALCKNIFLNNFQNRIVPFQVVLSKKTGLLPFHYSSLVAGDAKHTVDNSRAESQKHASQFAQPVLSYRLDDFIKQFKIELPCLIKIDVDGGELNVIKGTSETLLNPKLRSILIEINENIFFSQEIKQILEAHGFVLKSKHPRGKGEDSKIFNCIFERQN